MGVVDLTGGDGLAVGGQKVEFETGVDPADDKFTHKIHLFSFIVPSGKNPGNENFNRSYT
jgi:hypothetical protein